MTELIGYNCKKCKGKNFYETEGSILHTCDGVAEPVYEVSSPLSILKKAQEEFANDPSIVNRYNPEEPIYGHENRYQLARLQKHLERLTLSVLKGKKKSLEGRIDMIHTVVADDYCKEFATKELSEEVKYLQAQIEAIEAYATH